MSQPSLFVTSSTSNEVTKESVPLRAFVTGGTGFLGLNLVRELLDQGWRVTALHRKTSSLAFLSRFDADRIEGDVTDLESLRRAIPEGVDAVFHVAASTNVWSRRNDEQHRANVIGTRNVVAAARERGARRLVHTSSIAAYGHHDDPVDESSTQLGWRSWINYFRTKALAEDEVREGIRHGLDAVILNPSNIIGAYDLRSWSTMFQYIHAGKLPFVPPGRGSFCHAREVARAHIAAFTRGGTGANYLLGGTDASYRQMAGIIAELMARRVSIRTIPPRGLRALARLSLWAHTLMGKEPILTPEGAAIVNGNLLCKSDRAIDQLGYRPVPLEDMLRDCYQFLVDENRLTGRPNR